MNKTPLLHETWIIAKDHQEIKFEDRHLKIFNNKFGKNISGNIVHFGGGSGGGIWSYILAKNATKLTIVDYSPAMIKIIKNTFKLNNLSTKNIDIVCDLMESYNKNLPQADFVIFTWSMSFSNLNKTIKNITKNCKKGCKVIIAETLRPILASMRTDLSKETRSEMIKWKNNMLKIEELFNKNKEWKKSQKKEILGRGIPDLMLYYKKK